ncbi:hypothetical protein LIN78_06245 [Leeia sp. TBRC 13508]|uniref:KANL3/Tex30 alpha/beta hydrolase-like domain-containing protein n=1 Tax=Leeia speluncae TaxID=2884804 RepID=A0ABS8D4L8_9NEIS|nr:alpha/beta family hydrolase [Leeia speluncae]MCB6183140.1 hypothetical protein [Leeia speluncae]
MKSSSLHHIVMVGRQNLDKSNHPIDLITQYLTKDAFSFQWFLSKEHTFVEARNRWLQKFDRMHIAQIIRNWKLLNRIVIQLIKKTYWLMHPSALLYVLFYRQNNRVMANEIACLLKAMPADEVVTLLCYSAGGIQGSLASLESKVDHLICFGYPFQHPDKPPEAERTEHLAKLKTPTLIFQGTQDPYGHKDLEHTYQLSSSIHVELLDTDHEYRLSDTDCDRVYQQIKQFLQLPSEEKA